MFKYPKSEATPTIVAFGLAGKLMESLTTRQRGDETTRVLLQARRIAG